MTQYEYDSAIQLAAHGNLLLNTGFLLLYVRFVGLRILEPGSWYLMFHYLLFALRPALLYMFGYGLNYAYMGITPTLSDVLLSSLASNVALLSFLSATLLRGRRQFDSSRPLQPTRLERQSFWIAILICAPLISYSLLYALQNPLTETNAAAAGNVMTDPETGRKVFVTGSAYAYVLKNCIPGLLLALMVLYRPAWWNILPAAGFLTQSFLEGRGRFIIIYFLLALIVYYFTRRRVTLLKKTVVLGGFGIAAIALISLGGIYRRIHRSFGNVTWQDISFSDYLARTPLGDSLEFGMHEMLTYIVKFYPDQNVGFSYFAQYLDVLIKPIPRALWSGKPTGSLIPTVDLNDFGNFSGLTQSVVGAGWLSMGLIGVILLSFVSGYLMQSLLHFAARRWQQVNIRTIYIIALPFSVQWFRDGAGSIIEFYVFALYPLLLWTLLLSLARRNYLPTRAPVVPSARPL